MNTFLQDKARWKLFLKGLGMNQQEASELMGIHKNTLSRTISLANEQGRAFPKDLINLMNFMDLAMRHPAKLDVVLSLFEEDPDAFPEPMQKIIRFASGINISKEISL